jgi:hypothetical protein
MISSRVRWWPFEGTIWSVVAWENIAIPPATYQLRCGKSERGLTFHLMDMGSVIDNDRMRGLVHVCSNSKFCQSAQLSNVSKDQK